MDLDKLSEDELALEWKNNDNYEAATILYNLYEKKMLGYIYSKTSNYHDAQEILSDTFVRVANHIGNFRFECTFKVWVYKIANNLIKSHYKKKSRNKFKEDVDNFTDVFSVISESNSDFDDHQALAGCLSHIPERDRSITLLRHIEDLTLSDIADSCGLTIEGVRKIINKTVEKLRNCLEKKFGKEE